MIHLFLARWLGFAALMHHADLLAIDPDLAVTGDLQQIDTTKKGGFARTRGAKQRNDVAVLCLQGNAAQNLVRAEALADIADRKSGDAGHDRSYPDLGQFPYAFSAAGTARRWRDR